MNPITKFQADDGTEFNTKDACIAHEMLCAEIAEVMALLPPKVDDTGCEFSNGSGYIQHDPHTFNRVKFALLRIANRISPHKWFEQALYDDGVHESWPGRIISEMSAPLWRAWHRISCTDSQFREWGQPYFANNPDQATQKRLN